MARITVLGAGYMGTALAMVAARRGHHVHLWGTWLDDELVGAVRRGDPHPRLKIRLPDGLRVFASPELAAALERAEAVVCGVNSEGVFPVLERALPHLPAGAPLMSVTKGLLADEQGCMQRISQAVRLRLLRPAGQDRPWVAVGGPCKAMEVARGVSPSVVYASEDESARARCAGWLQGPAYTVTESDDLAGLEVCSAFKNAYATASGLCDGLQLAGHAEMYNTKALLFSQAVREIGLVVRAMGGRLSTAQGLAGVGDLHVTAAAGRNRAYGERVGRGERPDEVAAQMAKIGELTEGYPALHTGWLLAQQLAHEGRLGLSELPLLSTLHRIIYEGAPVAPALGALAVRG